MFKKLHSWLTSVCGWRLALVNIPKEMRPTVPDVFNCGSIPGASGCGSIPRRGVPIPQPGCPTPHPGIPGNNGGGWSDIAPPRPRTIVTEHGILLDASYRQGSGLIAPGEETDIRVEPISHLRIDDFVVMRSIARYFDVLSIKVGRDEQLALWTGIPASAFIASVHRPPFRLWTDCPPSLMITIRVRNIGKRPHHFRAYLVGSSLSEVTSIGGACGTVAGGCGGAVGSCGGGCPCR